MAKKKMKKKVTKKKTGKKKVSIKRGAPENKKMKFVDNNVDPVDNNVDPVDIPMNEDLQEDFKFENKSTLQTE